MARHAWRQGDPNAVRPVGGGGRLGHQDRHHGAQHVGDRRGVLGEPGPEGGGGEARFGHQLRAVRQRLVEGVQRVGVEQRQGGDQHVARPDAEDLAGVGGPPEVLRLRAAHPLGRPRRAGGVEDRDRLPGPDRRCRHRVAQRRVRLADGGQRRPGRGLADQPDPLQRQRQDVKAAEAIGKRTLDGEQPGAGVGEHVGQLRALRGHVQRHRHRPHPGAAEIEWHELRPVAAHEGHPVAPPDPRRLQGAGGAGGGLAAFGDRPGRGARLEQRPVGVPGRLPLQHRGQGALGRPEQARQGGRGGHDGCLRGGLGMRNSGMRLASQATRVSGGPATR